MEGPIGFSNAWKELFRFEGEWVKERAYLNPCAAAQEGFHPVKVTGSGDVAVD